MTVSPHFAAGSMFHSSIYGGHGPKHTKQTLEAAYRARQQEIEALPDNLYIHVTAAGEGVVPFIDGNARDHAQVLLFEPGKTGEPQKDDAVKVLNLKRKVKWYMQPVAWMTYVVRMTQDSDYRESAEAFIKRVIDTAKSAVVAK